MKMTPPLHLIYLIPVLFACTNSNSIQDEPDLQKAHVVMVSFDGFRYDYVSKYETPNFDKLIKNGSSASKMIPSYPSKTFPNHYTLVTGLYPGNHGLVDNSFFDPGRGEIYRINNRERVEDQYYYGGLPLWQLVQMNGVKSASYFWVGSEAPIAGNYPDYYYIYDGSVANESRIEQVETWLKLPEEDRPQFITLYFSFIDTIGHEYGPDSDEISDAAMEADRLLGILMDKLTSLDIDVNIIIVSDHGMYPMTPEPDSFISIDSIIEPEEGSFKLINNGTHVHLYLMDSLKNREDSIHSIFSQASFGKFMVYKKQDLPEDWHYKNDRVGDILLVSKPGYYFIKSQKDTSRWKRNWGTHGFDPLSTDEMGAIFFASGPNVKKGGRIDSFENIHVYPFIARILGMETPEIDGNPEVLGSFYLE